LKNAWTFPLSFHLPKSVNCPAPLQPMFFGEISGNSCWVSWLELCETRLDWIQNHGQAREFSF
jgi:hypothetical protein